MYFRSGDVLEEFFKPHRSKTPASSLLSTQVWCEVSWPLAFLWSWTWANLMGLGDSWHPNTWRRTWPKNCAVKMEAPKYMWKKMLFRWERNCKWEFWQIVLWVPWQDVWIMICFEFFWDRKGWTCDMEHEPPWGTFKFLKSCSNGTVSTSMLV